MRGLRSWVARLLALPRRSRLDQDLSDEIEAHLALHIDDNVRAGMTQEEARRQARARLGSVEAVKDACRDRRRFPILEDLARDVRIGVRLLAKRPGATLAGALTLALGIGANTAIFSVVHAVVLRPLPYEAPDRLVRIWEVTPRGIDDNLVSSGNYLDWRDQASSFEAIGAHGWPFGMALTGTGEPVRIEAVRLAPAALRALGTRPLVGRAFTDADVEQESAAVALLSHGFWQQQFEGDPAVAGRTIHLDDVPYTVVGVMPPEFDFTTPAVALWLPLALDEADRSERRSHTYGVVARLAPGTTRQAAQAELSTIASRIARRHPADMTGWGVNVVSLHDDLVGDVTPLLRVLAGFVGVVLVMAGANLAHLLLARAKSRETELAVRSALGGGRARLVRQLVTEVVVLGLLGGALGIGLGALTLELLVAAAPADIPLLEEARIDWAVLAFAAAITIGTSLLVGLVPAVKGARADLRQSLQGTPNGPDVRGTRLRRLLLVSQFALSILLLTGALLLVESFRRLTAVEHGFDPNGVLAVWLDLPLARYSDQQAQERFYERLLDRVRGLPTVESVAATTEPPISGYRTTFSFAIDGRPAANPTGREDPVQLRTVSPGYLQTLRIPLIAGRTLQETDRRGTGPVVMVNQALADRHWPEGSPIGQRISFVGAEGPWREIVGVVGDTRDDGLDRPAAPAIYIPFAQRRENWGWMSWQILMVRSAASLDPAAIAPAVRDTIWELDPALPLHSVATLDGLYAESRSRQRFAMQLAGGFAALSLLLAAIGLYGVVACSVTERRREIGVRLALGARPATIAGLLLRQSVILVAVGTAIGVVMGFWAMGALQSLLFDVPPRDPAAFLAASLLLLIVGAAASWLPARRAACLDPAEVLRAE